MKSRLTAIQNRHKVQSDKDNKDRPTLRRATADNPQGTDGSSGSGSSGSGTQNDDDRPTLKRNDGSGSGQS